LVHLKKGADGHLLKNAAGHLVKYIQGEPCSYCDCTEQYNQYQAVVSGVTVCNSVCYDSDPGEGDQCSTTVTGIDPNGNHTLTRWTDCGWKKVTEGTFGEQKRWGGANCGDEPLLFTTDIEWRYISISRWATEWQCTILYSQFDDFACNLIVFYGTKTVAAGDCGPVVIPNELAGCVGYASAPRTPCLCTEILSFGHGGTVTITPV